LQVRKGACPRFQKFYSFHLEPSMEKQSERGQAPLPYLQIST